MGLPEVSLPSPAGSAGEVQPGEARSLLLGEDCALVVPGESLLSGMVAAEC